MTGTEGLCLRNLVSSVDSSYSASSYHPFKFSLKTRKGRDFRIHRPSVTCSKAYDYQDFQGYARPLRLLPITEPSSCTQSLLEELSTSLRGDSESVYMITTYTSTMFGSGLSDLSAGVLLCLIDENGDSILQRLPATPVGVPMESDLPDLCFQRGSVDEFIFKGPKLGRLQTLWVGLESGRWRLGGVSLTVVYGGQAPFNNTENYSMVNQNSGLKYKFEAEDIQVGEVEGMSMVELKPSHVTELRGTDLLNLSNTNQSQPISLPNREVLNEESMKEYADLKSSLLLYDSLLILGGTSIAAISAGEEAALAFLIGGAGGFLYLLLLQKSVDKIPAHASISKNTSDTSIDQLLKRLKGPVASLALAVAFAGVAVKYSSGATPIALTPQEILVGMTGFLVCKVAVLLAAFKPMQIKLKENK